MKTNVVIKKLIRFSIITLFFANVAIAYAAEPEIVINRMPPIGQNGNAQGKIVWNELNATNSGKYAVIAMLHAIWTGGGGYYVKPYDNNYLNEIDANGNFSILITTGGIDADVDEVIFFFVERAKISNADVANPNTMTGKYLATKTIFRSVWINPPEPLTSNIRPGFVAAGTEITLSCQEGGSIRYTLDGSDPISSTSAQTYNKNVFKVPNKGVLLIKAVVKISNSYSPVSSLVWFPKETLNVPFWGLNVSLALNGEQFGYKLSEATTRLRMEPVVQLTKWVRTFGTINNGQEYINKIAKESGLYTMIGVYITNDATNNNAQIEGLRQILQTGPSPDLIAIGNEPSLLGVSQATLSSCIDAVRNMVIERGLVIPIGSVDIAGFSWSQSIYEKLDFLGVNIYTGIWDTTPENTMLDIMKQTFTNTVSGNPAKLVLLTETGATHYEGSYSFTGGTQTSSKEKAAKYLCGFLEWVQKEHIPSFYFEAYNEQIKSMNGGHPIEQFFGIMDSNLKILPFYSDCISKYLLTGIQQVNQPEGVNVYPNPTTGKVFFEKEANITVYNSQGLILQEFFGSQADISSYPQGVYLIKVDDAMVKVWKR